MNITTIKHIWNGWRVLAFFGGLAVGLVGLLLHRPLAQIGLWVVWYVAGTLILAALHGLSLMQTGTGRTVYDEVAHTVEMAIAPALEKPSRVVKYRLGDMLWAIVRRRYDNRPYSRRAMGQLGYDQRYWNLANACLIALGIRDAQKHAVWNSRGDSSKTLRYIGQNLDVADDGAYVRCRDPQGAWVTIDLHECHFLS